MQRLLTPLLSCSLAFCAAHVAVGATYTATLRQDEFSNPGHAAFTLTFTNLPPPVQGGTIRVRAFGDLGGANEYLEVYVDGIYFGPILNNEPLDDNFSHPSGTDQGYDYESSTLISNTTANLSLAQLQTMTADGTMNVIIDPSQSVNDGKAGEFVEVILTYDAAAPGACCIAASETCQDLTPDQCTTAGGTYAGSSTTCATYVCFPHGACCLPDGTCQGDNLTPAQCTALDGTFQGNASTCATSDCRLKGACCAGGSCTLMAGDDCTGAGSTYRGDNTTCGGDADGDGVPDGCDLCPNTVPGVVAEDDGCPPYIPGDVDRDGDVDLNDFQSFRSCASGPAIPRSTGCSGSDFDGDGDVDMSDFGKLQRCFSGESVPATVGCGN